MLRLGYWLSAAAMLLSVPLACTGAKPEEPLGEDLLAAPGVSGASGQGGAGAGECAVDGDCGACFACVNQACVAGPRDGGGCGSPNSGACDAVDSCLNGVCQQNHANDGQTCGDPASECSAQDTCQNGLCVVNDLPNDTACGAEATACSAQDTCRNGACVPNHLPVDIPCEDPYRCTEDDSCDGAGNCRPGTPNDLICVPSRCDLRPLPPPDTALPGCCGEYHCSAQTGCSATPAPTSFPCRLARDDAPCDRVEVCDGVSLDCPDDARLGSSTVCSAAVCTSDASGEHARSEVRCDGTNDACAEPVVDDCVPFQCNADATACRSACSNNGHCQTGAYCDVDAGECLPRTDVGRPCDGDAECAVGSTCVDGVCCDTGCDGQCEACDLGGSEGVCTPFSGDPSDHGRDACEDDGSACAGSCNGTRTDRCAYPDDGTRCAEPSCDALANEAVEASFCDGAGRCRYETAASCSPYVCFSDGCGDDCASDSECESDSYCRSGRCVPLLDDGVACTNSGQCTSGFCADDVCCDSACSGQCEACDLGASLGRCEAVSGEPLGDRPVCAGDGTCAGSCDGSRREACAYPGAEIECRAASCRNGAAELAASCDGSGACPETLVVTCPEGCEGPICAGDSCIADADCGDPARYCAAGVCRPLGQPGALCSESTQCTTGYCTDGVCCEQACLGQCEACNVAGSEGICSATPAGTEPRGGRMPCSSDGSECAGRCDGTLRDGCSYPDGVVCREPSCEGTSSSAVAIPEARCTGTGRCPEREEQNCADTGCTSDGVECNGLCADDPGACPGGSYCSAGVCVPDRPPGEPCGADEQCETGFCADGVCCNAACDGTCEACDAAGSIGTCTTVEGAPHGGRRACLGGGTCGARCDGTNSERCEFAESGTTCGGAVCGHGVRSESQACDGAGRCLVSERRQCPAFECNGSDCGTACLLDADCTGDYICSDGNCIVNPLVDAVDRGNCGCRVAGGGGRPSAFLALLGMGLVAAARRRPARLRKHREPP